MITTNDDTTASDAKLRRRLRRAINDRSLTEVSREVSVSREALLRYLARVDVQAGTLELIRGRLSRLGGRT